MGADSRNPGEKSPDAGLVTVSFKIPRWLEDEISQVAGRRLTTKSDLFREALLAWLPGQREKVA